jgi:uncharacterized protein YjbJ (UPF0337 family)
MTDHDKADQARKGLIDSVKGKAKEVVGAVTGNDSLTAEGQLEQTQAAERKEANSAEAVADAEAKEAQRAAAEARNLGGAARAAVAGEAAAAENDIQARRDAEKHAADLAANRDLTAQNQRASVEALNEVQHAKVEAREEIEDAADDLADAIDDHRSEVAQASDAEDEAERARQRAARLSAEADLP